MRKAVAFLTASLGLAWVVAANAQTAPDTFKDVPSDHWAYQAVDALRAKGILIGYPDGLYRGKRTMTRYEFAVALKRALDSIGTIKGEKGDPGAPGEPGAAGAQGPQGEKGESGVAPDDLAALKKLIDEFKGDLAKVGVDVNAANARIDKLAKDVAALKAQIAGMPKVFGEAFMGIRSDRASGFYVDQNGRVGTHGPGSLVNEALVTHDLKLGVQAKVGEGTNLTAAVVFGNYAGTYGLLSGNSVEPASTKPTSGNYIDQLEINAPFTGVGTGGSLTLGRFGYSISPLTLCKPSVDVYFNDPIVDDGNFRLDGFKVNTNLGSLGTTVFAGKTDTLTDAAGYAIMRPVVLLGGSIFANGKPTAMAAEEALLLNQVGGVTLTLPTTRVVAGGKLSVTGLLGTGNDSGKEVTNVAVLGADASLPLGEKTTVTAAWSKGITGSGRFKSIGTSDNNAFDGAVATSFGSINAKVGYRYIDPQFTAPGYWGRIGNWINPTNIQGPNVKVGYDFSPSLSLTASADMLKAARDRAAYSFGKDDRINRVAAGLKWDLSPSFSLTGDYEGVFYKMSGWHTGLPSGYADTTHPTEEYLTLGTGLKVNGATLLKLGYQIGTVDYKIFSPGGGYTYNTFFSQVAVKF